MPPVLQAEGVEGISVPVRYVDRGSLNADGTAELQGVGVSAIGQGGVDAHGILTKGKPAAIGGGQSGAIVGGNFEHVAPTGITIQVVAIGLSLVYVGTSNGQIGRDDSGAALRCISADVSRLVGVAGGIAQPTDGGGGGGR